MELRDLGKDKMHKIMLSLNEISDNAKKKCRIDTSPVAAGPALEMKKSVSRQEALSQEKNSSISRASLPKNYFKRTGSSSRRTRLTESHGSSSSFHSSVDEISKGKAGDAVQPRSDSRRISTDDVKRRWRARQIAKQVSPPPKRQSFLCWLRKLSPKSSDDGLVRRESQRYTQTRRVARITF